MTAKAAFGVALAAGLVYAATLHLGALSPAMAQLDMQEIFRCVELEEVPAEDCDRARELILNNCTNCHAFVPIVLQQFDDASWRGLLDRHRDRVRHLSDDDVEIIHRYLTHNFNMDLPPPELPPELLENWTSY